LNFWGYGHRIVTGGARIERDWVEAGMAIAPSTNLLSALSQLQQGSVRPAQPVRPAAGQAQFQAQAQAAGQTQAASQIAGSFAAQLAAAPGAVRNAAPAAATASAGLTAQASEQRQAITIPGLQNHRPIPTRGGYLGQHVNILV
jgi:hypothetical protein